MVLADSHGIPRAPRYSGTHSRRLRNFRLRESHPLRSHIPMRSASHHKHTLQAGRPRQALPQPQRRNTCRLSHATGLASSRSARHYSGNHGCFLFLQVLRCFSSPRSSYRPMSSDGSDPTSLGPGFPIRTPSDHSSFDNSPRTIAAYHVLHRLLVPRHPPNALKHLQQHLHKTPNTQLRTKCRYHQKIKTFCYLSKSREIKMLASTMHFSNNTHRTPTHPSTPHHKTRQQSSAIFDIRETTCVPSEPR